MARSCVAYVQSKLESVCSKYDVILTLRRGATRTHS
jgi:hypothetical protein